MTIKLNIKYCGVPVQIECSDIKEMHEIIAGIQHLDADVQFLIDKGVPPEDIITMHRINGEDQYYGVMDIVSGKSVSFGQKRIPGNAPFYPKGADGYYDPAQRQESGGLSDENYR